MNCPLCDEDLTADKVNMWLLCSSDNHKFKLAEMSDTTRKSITRKILSDSVIALRHGATQYEKDDNIERLIEEDEKLKKYVINSINEASLNGQAHAYQMLADYLSDDDWRDFLPE